MKPYSAMEAATELAKAAQIIDKVIRRMPYITPDTDLTGPRDVRKDMVKSLNVTLGLSRRMTYEAERTL